MNACGCNFSLGPARLRPRWFLSEALSRRKRQCRSMTAAQPPTATTCSPSYPHLCRRRRAQRSPNPNCGRCHPPARSAAAIQAREPQRVSPASYSKAASDVNSSSSPFFQPRSRRFRPRFLLRFLSRIRQTLIVCRRLRARQSQLARQPSRRRRSTALRKAKHRPTWRRLAPHQAVQFRLAPINLCSADLHGAGLYRAILHGAVLPGHMLRRVVLRHGFMGTSLGSFWRVPLSAGFRRRCGAWHPTERRRRIGNSSRGRRWRRLA